MKRKNNLDGNILDYGTVYVATNISEKSVASAIRVDANIAGKHLHDYAE
jgi:hypothetical protein